MRALLLIALTLPLGGQEIYDLLLKNGHVIDPSRRREGLHGVVGRGEGLCATALVVGTAAEQQHGQAHHDPASEGTKRRAPTCP